MCKSAKGSLGGVVGLRAHAGLVVVAARVVCRCEAMDGIEVSVGLKVVVVGDFKVPLLVDLRNVLLVAGTFLTKSASQAGVWLLVSMGCGTIGVVWNGGGDKVGDAMPVVGSSYAGIL